jgi:hypothetical protein
MAFSGETHRGGRSPAELVSMLWEEKFEHNPFKYFRDEIVAAVAALSPGKPEDVIRETSQVWWERLVTAQALHRNVDPSPELEQEIIWRVIVIWNLRDKASSVGVGPRPDGRLSIPNDLF